MKLKVSTFGIWLFDYGIKILQNQKKVVTYKSVVFGIGDSSSPINPSFILQNNPSFWVSKITLYHIFFEFGLYIPSCYTQDHLWTKLAPDSPFLRGQILNWGQLDKMQQLLSKFLNPNVFFLTFLFNEQ